MATKKKASVKRVAEKVEQETVVVKAVVDETGVVTITAVDDPGSATTGKAIRLKAVVDKETGVLTMVPVEDE